jgi:asparagine synthase (glutamine-hydrolysing)
MRRLVSTHVVDHAFKGANVLCGVIGYFGSFDLELLQRGLREIAHRGPDDAGMFSTRDSRVALGHARLSILDLSPLGHQPMLSEDGKVALTFNGEIYNFRELREELEARGDRFVSQSDTEVLLRLFLSEGLDMLHRLNGIFAFGIWDGRSNELFVVRDALGVKPLYYTTSSSGFAFSSEIKGLIPLMSDERELDPVALHRYLSFLWCPGEGTPLKAVRKILPGHAMRVKDGRVDRSWEWYRLPAFRDGNAELDRDSSIEGVRTHLRGAVHRQMVADVPVGAFLSGGLDSSAIVALARERNPDIRCFTIDSRGAQDAGQTDDLPYAKRVAKYLDVKLDLVEISAERMASDLEFMVAQLDEPLADPAPLNVYYISQLARKAGIKVLLSGAGGDDLFTGYRRHVAVNYEMLWRWLPSRTRGFLEQTSSRFDQRKSIFRRVAKFFRGASKDGDENLAHYFCWSSEEVLLQLYTPEFAAAISDDPAIGPFLQFLKPMPESVSRLDRLLALEQRFFLGDHNLTYTDKMSMAAGVEVRVPFLDLAVVDFAARVPSRFKQRGRVGKWVLKKAFEPYLPAEVIHRPKSGFGAPLRRWMRNELSELVGDLLSPESLRKRGLFRPGAVQSLIAANRSGVTDASYLLFGLLCIEIWCRTYVD